MCGIFGIVSLNQENIYERIINGLIQLQNRGYDSSGLCVLNNKHLEVLKYASTQTESSLQKLQEKCINKGLHFLGIGHNRWATHGVKNDTFSKVVFRNNPDKILRKAGELIHVTPHRRELIYVHGRNCSEGG